MKTQKGITLIALIITIIVMLILVGVSVSAALNTGLFKTAQGAAKNTEAERVNETKISEGKIQKEDGTWVDIEGYVDSLGAQTKVKEEFLDYEKAIAAGYTHKISINVKTDEDGNLDETGTIDLGTYEYYIKENETTGADLANNTIEFSVKDGVLLFLDRFYVNGDTTSWLVDEEARKYGFDRPLVGRH